jgi:hypothetical protein|tara:strand:- start:255 stop:473 length:219 start_codon:yes stop_codon:yes gene_type:complete
MSDTKATDAKAANWAELSDHDEDDDNNNTEDVPAEPKKVIPPKMKGEKNVNGDYVITGFEIADTRTGVKKGA